MIEYDPSQEHDLWTSLVRAIETYRERVPDLPVAPRSSPDALREQLRPFDFQTPIAPEAILSFVVDHLTRDQIHSPHPRYFGLFNPAPTAPSIAADVLVATFNPQMASWNHSPFAVETEHHLIQVLGARLGFPETDGTFCSGGAEANHTAVLTALTAQFPQFPSEGVRALDAQPVLYISPEGHHSVHKAARLCGLGDHAVREIPTTKAWRIDPEALTCQIAADRAAGFAPFLVVATAGTTNAGIVDPLADLVEIAARERLWLHVDAAWGGAAALVPEHRDAWFNGLDRADSITLDAHKWLSVPMGAGIYLTRHLDILARTFRTSTPYMPTELDALAPYGRSIQWSRRFIGLKLFMSLAASGWDLTTRQIDHMIALGDSMRQRLEAHGWSVCNQTPLPVVCFVDSRNDSGATLPHLKAIEAGVVESGRAWISTTTLGRTMPVLRACITNYRTQEADLDILIETLEGARRTLASSNRISSPNPASTSH